MLRKKKIELHKLSLPNILDEDSRENPITASVIQVNIFVSLGSFVTTVCQTTPSCQSQEKSAREKILFWFSSFNHKSSLGIWYASAIHLTYLQIIFHMWLTSSLFVCLLLWMLSLQMVNFSQHSKFKYPCVWENDTIFCFSVISSKKIF